MESRPVEPVQVLLADGPMDQNDLFGQGGYDLSGFDTQWEIDAGLREEISTMEFSSLQQVQILPSAIADPFDLELMHLQNVERLWFTNVTDIPPVVSLAERRYDQISGPLSPQSQSPAICEEHRQNMRERLQIFTHEPTVPSIDLLNVSLRFYFAKVHAKFPLVHAATFRPCRQNANLVIAMCAIGGLFTGSDQSLQQGVYLFERVHKATLHNWERLLAKRTEDLTTIIQSVLISQVFALLSDRPNLLLTVDAFHGPPIAWSRYLRLYARPQVTQVDLGVDGLELERNWHSWAREEERLRVAHGLYIVDAEVARLLHHETIQGYEEYKLSFTCSEKAFSASNALDWKRTYLAEMGHPRPHSTPPASSLSLPGSIQPYSVPDASSLTAYVILENISAQVIQRKQYKDCAGNIVQFLHQSFTDLHHHLVPSSPLCQEEQPGLDALQLQVFGSLIYMEALADFDLLERAVGRDGSKLTPEEYSTVTAWASSVDARRCMLHTLIIKNQVEEMRVSSELALHVAPAMFWAGIALFCYIRFNTQDKLLQGFLPPAGVDLQEFSLLGVNLQAQLSEAVASEHNGLLSLKMTFFSITDLLRLTGH